MSSKNFASLKNSQSSFVSQDLINEDQRGYLSLSNSNVLVESLSRGRDRNSDIQISAPRPELTSQWWTLFTSIPAGENPLVLANEGVMDDILQSGEVHFLGGVFDSSRRINVEREIFVSQDQSIVLPILTVGVDNVGWDFGSDFPVPYQFPIDELQIIADAIMDTATNVSLSVNGNVLIDADNMDQFRLASNNAYTLKLPEDDILGYRALYPLEWVKPPYTQGVQDGYWVEIKNLPLGDSTIEFTGNINYKNIDVRDYNNSGSIGDTSLESLLQGVRDYYSTTRLDVTYNVDVLSGKDFNAQLQMMV